MLFFKFYYEIFNINYDFFYIIIFILNFSIFFFIFKGINLNFFNSFKFKNSNFFKESFYIDNFQKKLTDNFFKKTLITSVQFYNFSIYINITTRYIYSFIVSNFFIFFKTSDDNIYNVIVSILFFFSIIFNFSLIILLI